MISLNQLPRLAGAQPEVLRKARTDTVKYTAMGGVLLTTAGVAGVSAAFALNTAVGLPAVAAVIAGVLWAVVIFNLDRMLIVSMTRQSGWWRNLLMAVPRLVLAIVIGAVISVPLVLRIFQPEINSELQVMHAENLITAQKKLDEQFADVGPMQEKVDGLQAVASGASQPSVSGDPDVVAAQKQVDEAQAAYDKADADRQCELVGSCGTGVPGVGEAERQAERKANEARDALNAAKAKLSAATAAAQAKIGGSVTSNKEAATAELKTLVPLLDQRKADRAAAQARLDSGELNDEGLLARLEALDRLSADRASMAAANWALFLLFMLIEILPVAVKLMSMVGPPTLYDRLLAREETTLETRATMQDDVVVQLEQHRVTEQIRQGKQANTVLVDKQSEIARKAIDVWGEIATSRSEEELARWYARHSGQRPAGHPAAAPAAPPAPAPAPANNAADTLATETTATDITTITTPTAPPPPAPVPFQHVPGAGQTYQQFKAAAGAPTTNNNHQAGGPATPSI